MIEDSDSISISKLSKNEYPLWDRFVESSPEGTFFHKTNWADLLSTIFNREYEVFICTKSKNIIGGILLFGQKRLFLNISTPLFLYPYSEPLYYQPENEKYQKTTANRLMITSQIIQYLEKNYSIWILDTSSNLKDTRAFQWAGCIVEPAYNYVLPLNKIQTPYSAYSQSFRKKIKYAKQLNANIIESETVDILIDLYTSSYLRHGIKPVVNQRQLKKIIESALQFPEIKLYHCEIKNKVIASRLILCDKDTIYDLIAGSDDDTGVGSCYLLHSILMMYTNSHNKFDFMGAGHPQIERFKRGFGGELVHGFRITGSVKFPISVLLKLRRYQLNYRRKS